jgi:hypothetical protein
METLGRLLNGAFLVAVIIGWIAILLPAVVKRLRRYPRPTFPPAPLARSLGPDGAANAAVIVEAIRAIVAVSVRSGAEEPSQIVLSPLDTDATVVLSWSDPVRLAGRGTFYLEFSALGSDAVYELDMDTDPSPVFWIAVGYLRDGSVEANGHVWIHVTEVGMWHPYSASSPVGDYEPEWVTSLPV